MENYQEDKKILIIGIQLSLILHILIYILLKLIPNIHLEYPLYQQIVEINIEDIPKQQVQNIKISKPDIIHNKKQETMPKEGIKEAQKPQNVNQVLAYQEAPKPATKQPIDSTQKPERPAITVDDSNLALLHKVVSANVQPKEEGKTSEISIGEPLSKFDKNIEGDAISRRVIYKPSPIKVETDIPQPSVRVKIFISPSGDVTKVQLLTLTSDPVLNREIVNYMLKWKFNKIDENITQYAVLTIYFTR